jgi:hypothetical protein
MGAYRQKWGIWRGLIAGFAAYALVLHAVLAGAAIARAGVIDPASEFVLCLSDGPPDRGRPS